MGGSTLLHQGVLKGRSMGTVMVFTPALWSTAVTSFRIEGERAMVCWRGLWKKASASRPG